MSPRTRAQNEGIRHEKRELIIRTALRLFGERGFHATPIQQIASAAGISKGLMYSYFVSKEELLSELFQQYIEKVGHLLNPDHDDQITTDEMLGFFHGLRASLRDDREYWHLFFQLTMQPDVLQWLLQKVSSIAILQKQQQMIKKYFTDRYKNPDQELFYFSALIKGFSLQYTLMPGYFSEEVIDDFIHRLIKTYILND
jgi:AcrR family transcriptional regulator